MRGENCPIDSCTATVITVSTTEISVISDVMIVLRSVWAAVGVPVTSWLTNPSLWRGRSRACRARPRTRARP